MPVHAYEVRPRRAHRGGQSDFRRAAIRSALVRWTKRMRTHSPTQSPRKNVWNVWEPCGKRQSRRFRRSFAVVARRRPSSQIVLSGGLTA